MYVPVHTCTYWYVLICTRIIWTSHFLNFDIIILYPLYWSCTLLYLTLRTLLGRTRKPYVFSKYVLVCTCMYQYVLVRTKQKSCTNIYVYVTVPTGTSTWCCFQCSLQCRKIEKMSKSSGPFTSSFDWLSLSIEMDLNFWSSKLQFSCGWSLYCVFWDDWLLLLLVL